MRALRDCSRINYEALALGKSAYARRISDAWFVMRFAHESTEAQNVAPRDIALRPGHLTVGRRAERWPRFSK